MPAHFTLFPVVKEPRSRYRSDKMLSARFMIHICLSYACTGVNSLNILGVFPYEGKSHFFVYEPLLLELAKKGHNLTVISHFPQQKPFENYHDISLAGKSEILEGVFPLERSYWNIIEISLFLVKFGTENCKLLLGDKGVQDLWKSDYKFDVVLVEQFNSDCALGLAHQLGAPVVGLTSNMLMPWHYNRFGLQYNPSYMSFLLLDGGTRPNLYQRVERIVLDMYLNILYKYYCQRKDENTLAKYFSVVPPLEELGREIKFMLVYQSAALTGSNMIPSNMKEVGGYHVAETKELPTDLKTFIDEAEHGVIYISFGSMLKANSVPKDKLNAIVEAISHLPQRIIWKWESDTLPGNPKNVYISKWLPQNDILAHPKVYAFFSHCGMLGTTEAIQHGVPMVGMPIFGDQPGNAAMVEESGLGVQLRFKDLTKDLLLEKLETVLDPSFRSKVKYLSKAWHERPQSPMESAIYWTEYAAHYKNISFKSAAVDTPMYQIMGLDILCIVLATMISLVVLIKSLFQNKIREEREKKLN